jgi:formylglycine-generating enzyme required for sulfatase activity
MIDPEDVLASWGDDDPVRFVAIADHFLEREDPALAASALDRAYGLAPGDAGIARHRASILDQLAIHEHGLAFRYVPAGTFQMGSHDGDPDERPVHPRRVDAFWITDVPITWAAYCRLLGWMPPPNGWPENAAELPRAERFTMNEHIKIRRQYCESETLAARDWHAHAGMTRMGKVPRARPDEPERFDRKPLVAVALAEARMLTIVLTAPGVRYTIASEAQWEKAARGGLVGKRYSWGDAVPTRERCDFDRMGAFRLTDPRALPANGYGLHGMCGGVADLTHDVYDALAYQRAADGDVSPALVAEGETVIRGGSWADCASGVTVSFRATNPMRATPNIGFRLVRELFEPAG